MDANQTLHCGQIRKLVSAAEQLIRGANPEQMAALKDAGVIDQLEKLSSSIYISAVVHDSVRKSGGVR